MSDRSRQETDLSWPLFEDGPFWYTRLPEPEPSRELQRLACAASPLGGVDSINFQPCPDPSVRNEDRWVAEYWTMPDGEWTCVGVFDGHGGSETASYAAKRLPAFIQKRVATLLPQNTPRTEFAQTVSATICSAIEAFDDTLTAGLKNIFPESPEELEGMSDAEVRDRLARDEDGSKRAMLVRCMRGTTVVLAITDPTKKNMWIASLGDSVAVLGMPRLKGPTHQARVLGRAHNAIGEEAKRIRTDHTGEPDVVLDNRVLGTLAVTRAIGDHILKLPVVYTHKVFGNVEGGMRALGPVLARIRTPPYVSARAHVEHAVPPDGAILVLASDGLQGLQHGRLDPQAWVASAVRPATHHERAAGWEHGGARALVVLRDALGGADGARVSAMMTAEMMDKWCDDVTVVVQRLCDE